MGRKRTGRAVPAMRIDPVLVRGTVLALAFLLGAVMGQACASEVDSTGLRSYLTDYCAAVEEGAAFSAAASAALYYGYVLLVFLLGFASVGAVLIPVVSALYGFLTMYTIACFVSAFGRWGVVLALAALGVRLFFTLPCFFALSAAAWPLAAELAVLSLGRGKRSSPVLYGKNYFLLFLVCVVILTAGLFCERFLTPVLFRLALEGAL